MTNKKGGLKMAQTNEDLGYIAALKTLTEKCLLEADRIRKLTLERKTEAKSLESATKEYNYYKGVLDNFLAKLEVNSEGAMEYLKERYEKMKWMEENHLCYSVLEERNDD